MWFSYQMLIIFQYSLNKFVFVIEVQCASFHLEIEFFNTTLMNIMF